MLALCLALTLGLLALCSFAPGFAIVRLWRWRPLETLCASVGLSLVLIYLAGWAVFLLLPGRERMAFALVSAVCAALAVMARRDLVRLLRAVRVRQALAGYGFLLVWSVLLLAMIRNYSGAGWSADWLEHFQRSLFFLRHFPHETILLPGYQLPARPPMMNVVASFFLGQVGERFEIFQLIFVFLNLLLFLPCCLLMPALAGRRRTSILPLVGIFAMSPLAMEAVTYTWTKALAAFFVVLALSLYLSGWRRGDSRRTVAAFVSLTAGLLVHYSVGPYGIFLGLHYLYTRWRQRDFRVREMAAIAILCGALAGTWFAWSMAAYGAHTTLASNTSVTSSQAYEGSNLDKVASNLIDTIVPGAIRDSARLAEFDQPNAMGQARDNLFILYQTNLLFGMGLIGGPLVVWLLFRRPPRGSEKERRFWMMLVPFAVVAGIAVVGERDFNGVAHLTLLAMEAIGLTLLAAAFSWRRSFAWIILAGCVVDFGLGVFLQERIQNLENIGDHHTFREVHLVNNHFRFEEKSPDALSEAAWSNWYRKHQWEASDRWLRMMTEYRPDDPTVVRPAAILKLARTKLDEAEALFHGWYQSHGGVVEFFGDHIDGIVPTVLLLLLWPVLLWQMWREAQRTTVESAPAAPVKSAPRDRKRGGRRGK